MRWDGWMELTSAQQAERVSAYKAEVTAESDRLKNNGGKLLAAAMASAAKAGRWDGKPVPK